MPSKFMPRGSLNSELPLWSSASKQPDWRASGARLGDRRIEGRPGHGAGP